MAEVVADIGDVKALVRHVDADRVPEDVRMPEIARETRDRGIAAEEIIDRAAGERDARFSPAAEKEPATVVRPDREVAPQENTCPREEVVPLRLPFLKPGDVDAAIAKPIEGEDRRLATPEAVEIHEVEEEPVTNVLSRDRAEERPELFLR